jgi:hypothetical protein
MRLNDQYGRCCGLFRNPETVIVASDNPELITPRRKIGIIGFSPGTRVNPAFIKTFEQDQVERSD